MIAGDPVFLPEKTKAWMRFIIRLEMTEIEKRLATREKKKTTIGNQGLKHQDVKCWPLESMTFSLLA